MTALNLVRRRLDIDANVVIVSNSHIPDADSITPTLAIYYPNFEILNREYPLPPAAEKHRGARTTSQPVHRLGRAVCAAADHATSSPVMLECSVRTVATRNLRRSDLDANVIIFTNSDIPNADGVSPAAAVYLPIIEILNNEYPPPLTED